MQTLKVVRKLSEQEITSHWKGVGIMARVSKKDVENMKEHFNLIWFKKLFDCSFFYLKPQLVKVRVNSPSLYQRKYN